MTTPIRPHAAVLAAGLLLTAGGCRAVGPDYRRPTLPAPEAWSDPAARAEALDPRWWASLNDPALTALVQRALEGNRDLAAARARVVEAGWQRVAAQGRLSPTLTATSDGIVRRRGAGSGSGIGGSPTVRFATAGFTAGWELDVFGGRRRAEEAAAADEEAAGRDRDAVLIALAAEVAAAYVELRSAQQRAIVLAESARLERESESMVKARRDAGLATDLDVARAVRQRATTAAAIPRADGDATSAAFRLDALCGLPPGSLRGTLEAVAPIPVPPASIAASTPSSLLLRRPDVAAEERRLAAETARVGVAVADLYPSFSLGLASALEGGQLVDLVDPRGASMAFGPTLRWPLFRGGALRAAVAAQDARVRQAALRYEQAFLDALAEVEDALTGWRRETDRLEALGEASDAARDASRLARSQFEGGSVSFFDVLDADRLLEEALLRQTESQAALALRVVALYKALGGGWEPAPR